MYKLYTVWSKENSRKKVSARLYRDIFNTKFNLGFGVLRSDTCCICDRGSEGVAQHRSRAESAFSAMKHHRKQAVENKGIMYVTFDMQKNAATAQMVHQHFLLSQTVMVIQHRYSYGHEERNQGIVQLVIRG